MVGRNANTKRKLVISAVGVEKLDFGKSAEIGLRQDALQTIFSDSPRHFLSPKFVLISEIRSFSTATAVHNSYAPTSSFGPAARRKRVFC